MKRNSKKIILLIYTVIITSGLGLTQNVHAEWEKEGADWKYLGDYGYKMGWEQVDGKWFYFTPGTGIMKIGWFYDKQYDKWYYLNFDGDMDGNKSSNIYPVELSNIQNKIKQYTNEDIIYKCTSKVDDNVFVSFVSKNEDLEKQYYYHPLTGNIYEIKNGMLTNLETMEVINIFTQDQAIQSVKDYLSKNNKYIPQIIKAESENEDSYLIHCYDNMDYYATASSWYYVNKTTREVNPML